MTSTRLTRRSFIKTSATAATLFALPEFTFASASPPRIRLEWQQFKRTPQYGSFYSAIRTMRANTNPVDRNSWLYWKNVHVNYCPHGAPYFVAWHRGYIYFFEKQLRIISGDNALNLPYWDYYQYAGMPAEFTDPASNNPLYMARANTNIYNALDLSPFTAGVYNFQRGTFNAFEPKLESGPHNPVHDLIGGVMATMQSPLDPIFYLHHAMVDRLTHAWALPDGKGIPYTAYPYSVTNSDAYWAGTHIYASDLAMPRYLTYDPAYLGYDYEDHSVPTTLPPSARLVRNPIQRVQAQMQPLLNRPRIGGYAAMAGSLLSAGKRSLGGVANVILDETSVSARIVLSASDTEALNSAIRNAATNDGATIAIDQPQSVKIVIDKVGVSELGKAGGYFYNLYINLPESGDTTSTRQKFFLGTIGAFQIDGAAHHGVAMLDFPATEVMLRTMQRRTITDIVVSFARVNGSNAPKGQTLRIGEVRIEISTEEPWDRHTPVPRPANVVLGV